MRSYTRVAPAIAKMKRKIQHKRILFRCYPISQLTSTNTLMFHLYTSVWTIVLRKMFKLKGKANIIISEIPHVVLLCNALFANSILNEYSLYA